MVNMSATIDPVRRLYLCAGNGGSYKVSLNAPYTATQLNGSNCGSLGSISAPGFTYDPVQNRIVGWTGGNTAYIYNPDTDSCTAQTYSGGPTTIQGNGTYGRFAYSPALGVFVVANSIDTNVYSLRLTAGGGAGGSGGGPDIFSGRAKSITTRRGDIKRVGGGAGSAPGGGGANTKQ